MLDDHLFDEQLAARQQAPVELLPVLDLRRVVAVDTGAGLSDRLLRDDRAVAPR